MAEMKQLTFEDLMEKHRKGPYKNLENINVEHFKQVLKDRKVKVSQLAKIEGMPVSEGALRLQINRGRMNPQAVCLIADFLEINGADLIRDKREVFHIDVAFFDVDVGGRFLSRYDADIIQQQVMKALETMYELPGTVSYYVSMNND